MGVLPYCSWRLYAGAREALEIPEPLGFDFRRSRPDAAEFRPDAEAGRSLAGDRTQQCGREDDRVRGVHRERTGRPEAPCAEGPRVLFQSAVRRIQGPNAL